MQRRESAGLLLLRRSASAADSESLASIDSRSANNDETSARSELVCRSSISSLSSFVSSPSSSANAGRPLELLDDGMKRAVDVIAPSKNSAAERVRLGRQTLVQDRGNQARLSDTRLT